MIVRVASRVPAVSQVLGRVAPYAAGVLLFACSNTDTVWLQAGTEAESPRVRLPSAPRATADAGHRLVERPTEDAGRDAAMTRADSVPLALRLERVSTPALSTPVEGCHLASPVALPGGFATAAGPRVRAFSPTGELRWETTLPAPDAQRAFVVATPLTLGSRLVVAYHTVPAGAAYDVNTTRLSQRVVVLDAETGLPDRDYEPLLLEHAFQTIGGQPVPFRADHALARGALVSGRVGSRQRVLVTFGNARDIQPWHGFAFEIDLDAWKDGGTASAFAGRLTVTPEDDCGREGSSGSRERRCGGGLWAPSGPLVVQGDASYWAVLAPGNGQLDLDRRDYANTLMRVEPGLNFDPGCSDACSDFDANAPSTACVESCSNLFIPRDSPGDPFPRPESGACDGLTLFECWQALDYIGGSTPALLELEGRELLVYPAKDGAVYLIDANHLGTLYDRRQLVAVCGTRSDPCRQDWAGMIVTQPAVVPDSQPPQVLVPTFMPDRTHPAGVVSLTVVGGPDGRPRFEPSWQYPPFDAEQARRVFREHPSQIRLVAVDGAQVALIVEAKRSASGRLLALRASDGVLLAEAPLDGPGYRFTTPLVVGDQVIVPSCESDSGPSHLEAFRLRGGGAAR
jgi:hypothetical protein